MSDEFDADAFLANLDSMNSFGSSSFDDSGFNTAFDMSNYDPANELYNFGSGFDDSGNNIDFLNDLNTGDIFKYSGSGFDDDGNNIDLMDELFGRDKSYDNTLDASRGSKDDFMDYIKNAAVKKLTGGSKSGGSKNNTLAKLLALGGASFLKDRGAFKPDIPVVGYQGKIPEYQAIQEVVKGRDDSNRRPGSGGRRYMSDVIYAKAPENQEPMSVAEAKAKAKAQAQGFAEGGDVAAFLQGMARGGEVGYLDGDSDGQADEVKANIDGVQEARLSDGEYVLPADLVSLLGNGNSDAGAKALDKFMAMVRKKGTGTEKQQKNIDAVKVLETLTKKPKQAPRANKALARKMGKG